MTYEQYLAKMCNYSVRTIKIYSKYAALLDSYSRDYQALFLVMPSYAVNTKRLIVAALKNYYRFLGDARYQELIMPKRTTRIKPHVTREQYEHYLTVLTSKTRLGLQKRLIVRLLFETGLRAHELLGIKQSDIKGQTIMVLGKGNKERLVKVSPWLAADLSDYLRFCATERLFNFSYKNLHQKVKRIDSDINLSPHMFRRGYAKYCYDAGVPLYDISLSMGHASIDTTSTYIKRSSADVEIYKVF